MPEKFKHLIENCQRILVTSHISPDPDAVSSLLLMSEALRTNFPKKTVLAVLEEEPTNLSFISGYQNIKFAPLSQQLEEFKPDLFILVDANNFERCSRHHGAAVREYINRNKVASVIIDHHEPVGKDEVNIYINHNSPACAQDVYEVCFDVLKLNQPDGAAQTAMTGLYADSGGFAYMKDGTHRQLFALAERLIDDGANVELIKNQLNRYSTDNIRAISQLFKNIHNGGDYTYSFLEDSFIEDWLAKGLTYSTLQLSTGVFLDEFIRNIDDCQWGFIAYMNKLQGDKVYSISLRSVNGVKDVAALAQALGGGGHKGAAGAKFAADSIEDAVNKVKGAIASS